MAFQVSLAPPQTYDKELNIWSTPDFMQAVQQLHHRQAWHIQCWKGNELVAVFPFYENKLLSYRAIVSPSSAYYNGMNLFLNEASSVSRRLLDTLQITQSIAQFIYARYQKVRFNLDAGFGDVRGFTWEKLKARPLYTFVHNYEGPLQPLSDEKKKLTLARSQAYHFAEAFNLDDFIRLFSAMFKRKHKELGFSYPDFGEFLGTLHQLGLARQFNLYRDNRVVSSNIVYIDPKGYAYAVFRATDEAEMKYGASSLHTLELLQSLAEDIIGIDFCGANVPEIARFKAAQGLSLKVFYQIYR
ncbi:MAG: GNAT family N-acetyltransferase [Candidatus Cloacimonetes bacterium]|nr:GNAT family N-acetyltransferase [Candidatus Cloacimonadota bacterium]